VRQERGHSINGQAHFNFGIVIEGECVAGITGEQLATMGYYYTDRTVCWGAAVRGSGAAGDVSQARAG
jgi:hypothetical protein